jgi:hypothetical protein
MSGKRAFVVIPDGWPLEQAGLHAAASASKARYSSYVGAIDAGWTIPLSRLRVLRLPAMDAWASEQPDNDGSRGWTIDYIPGALDALRARVSS